MAEVQTRMDEFDGLDPLGDGVRIEREILLGAKRKEIRNIVQSYTGSFDFLSEPIQNALDAIEERGRLGEGGYVGKIWVTVDLPDERVIVTDNGVGFSHDQFQSFLRPNVSFKPGEGRRTRGNKGVGATYLAYGFNHLEVSTKTPDFSHCVSLKGGREWLEDESGKLEAPKFTACPPSDAVFQSVDRGSSFVLKLVGEHIRPSDLNWLQARNSEQWGAVLRVKTPLGGVYPNSAPPPIEARVIVIDRDSTRSETLIKSPEYYYPHTIDGFKTARLADIIAAEVAAASGGKPVDKIPAKFKKLHGMYDLWSADDILAGTSTIRPDLDEEEKALLKQHNAQIYGYFCYSTALWDTFNDQKLKLREGRRILRGGLQLASRGMPQGELITIPLTSAIGYQQTTHVIVHLEGADPDLGRKGYQPELVRLAGDLARSVVSTLKGRRDRLLTSPGAPTLLEDQKWHVWVREQEEHETNFPLILDPKVMARAPLIAIDSIPQSEQDVIAFFNQLLSAGVLRGYQLLATSQRTTYDGLFRVRFNSADEYEYHPDRAPLGLAPGIIPEMPWRSNPCVVEYKFSIDGLIEDFEQEVKIPKHVVLAVAWKLGDEWKREWQALSLLDPANLNQRLYYGATHLLTAQHGGLSIHLIILSDLLDYIRDPQATVDRHEKELANQ